MNEHLRPASLPSTTQAAEGLPRRRWSVAEIEAMVAKGIILEDERFELIGGEVVPMSPKGYRHELVKKALQQYWTPKIVGTPIDLITETTLYVSEDEFRVPVFLFWPRSIPLKDVAAACALLIVEVADTSLEYDLGAKATTYAELGVQELWVINAQTLVNHPSPARASRLWRCTWRRSERAGRAESRTSPWRPPRHARYRLTPKRALTPLAHRPLHRRRRLPCEG